LFLVPKYLVGPDGALGEHNDVVLAGINHKMGYRGTVNTAPVLGDGVYTPDGQPGAVGYLAWNGDADTAIAIRTAVIKDRMLHVQAGAGIVADIWSFHRRSPRARCGPACGERQRGALPQFPSAHHTPFRQGHRGPRQVLA
jgi:butyryl-CoA dehydrogenase